MKGRKNPLFDAAQREFSHVLPTPGFHDAPAILSSVTITTPGCNWQPVGIALQQCKTRLYVADRFGRSSWAGLYPIFSPCWNTCQTWCRWSSAFIRWAVTCDKGLVPASVIWLWGGESQHCQTWWATRWLGHELSEIINYGLMYAQISATL